MEVKCMVAFAFVIWQERNIKILHLIPPFLYSLKNNNKIKKKKIACACCPTSGKKKKKKVEWDSFINLFSSPRDIPFWRDACHWKWEFAWQGREVVRNCWLWNLILGFVPFLMPKTLHDLHVAVDEQLNRN